MKGLEDVLIFNLLSVVRVGQNDFKPLCKDVNNR